MTFVKDENPFIMYNSTIPINSRNFQKIVCFYLFECPVRTFTKKIQNDAAIESAHSKYDYQFHRVSNRGQSFADRGIQGAKLNSFRAAMKRVAAAEIQLLAVSEIPEVIDDTCEYLIIKANPNNVSNTEGFFYCIRNAFAHGSFNVTESKEYYFTNTSRNKIKGIGKISEKTLLAWINLFNSSLEEIKNAGK